VDEQVLLADRREEVELLAVVGGEGGSRRGGPRRIAQLGVPLARVDAPQVCQVEHAVDVVDVALVEPEPAH
jgi:hypothetical protein